MLDVRFFTLPQCPDCMCDLPHRRTKPGHFPGKDELNPRIGIIIRNYFPRGRAARDDVTKTTLPRLGRQGQHLLGARFPGSGSTLSESGRFPLQNSIMAAF